MFAGQANVSRQLRMSGYPGVSCDVDYGGNGMNLLTPAGMAFLCCNIHDGFPPFVCAVKYAYNGTTCSEVAPGKMLFL